MSLQAVPLKVDYRSDEDNLVSAFYIPCLSESREYWRAVGYFTSGSLALAAKGIYALLQNGGSMRLVASPLLTHEDIDAINRGYAARSDVFDRALLRAIDPKVLADATEIELRRLDCLAWLIAEDRLEIRIAYPDISQGKVGIYHEKLGVFRDTQGNAVAFTGSANETVGGLLSNFESLDVYWSWADPQNRVSRKTIQFERLWTDATPGLRVETFSEAVRRGLLELRRTETKPKSDPEEMQSSPPSPVVLRPYQDGAISAWLRNGARGLFAMATGSGKTITALSAASRWLDQQGRGIVLISCPYQHLVEQWRVEAERFGFEPILAFQNAHTWTRPLGKALTDLQYGLLSTLMVITTHSTLTRPAMQKLLPHMDGPVLFIADEAHHLGAPDMRLNLPSQAQARLGLSATPERWQDDEGTRFVQSYFGPVVSEYTLGRAITEGRLTPYYYYPHLVALTGDEERRYDGVSKRIARLYRQVDSREREVSLERILRERSSLLNSAHDKIDVLRSLLEFCHSAVSHTLFYCSPQNIDAVESMLRDELRMRIHRFTAQEDMKDRGSLLAALSAGDIQGLVAIRCLDEGVDVPCVRTAYILASSGNPREFIQRRGRLLRLSPGKMAAEIHDLLTTPSSFGSNNDTFEMERRLVRRELLRVREFAASAINYFEATNVVLPLARRYHLMDI